VDVWTGYLNITEDEEDEEEEEREEKSESEMSEIDMLMMSKAEGEELIGVT